MVPAQERLDADDLGGAERDLGLVVEDELAPVGRAAKRVLDLRAAQRASAHLGVEEVQRGAALLLGHLARGVGAAQHVVDRQLARRRGRDADRTGCVDAVQADRERVVERGEDPVAELERVGVGFDALTQHDELVATPARHGVAVADDRDERRATPLSS